MKKTENRTKRVCDLYFFSMKVCVIRYEKRESTDIYIAGK